MDDAEKKAAEIVSQLATVVARFGALAQPVSNQIVAAALREKDEQLTAKLNKMEFYESYKAEIARLNEAVAYAARLDNAQEDEIKRLKAESKELFELREMHWQQIKDLDTELEAARAAGKALYQAADQARQAAEQAAERQREYKRLYDLRGEALKRGCPKCGYVQAAILAQAERKK